MLECRVLFIVMLSVAFCLFLCWVYHFLYSYASKQVSVSHIYTGKVLLVKVPAAIIFYKGNKVLAFNRNRCCHLSLCLQLILFHCLKPARTEKIGLTEFFRGLYNNTFFLFVGIIMSSKSMKELQIEGLSFLSYVRGANICGLYYKTITIVIMTIVSDATIWSVTLTIVIDDPSLS